MTSLRARANEMRDSVSTQRIDAIISGIVEIAWYSTNVVTMKKFLADKAILVGNIARYGRRHNRSIVHDEIGSYLDQTRSHISMLMSNITDCERLLAKLHSTYLAKLSGHRKHNYDRTVVMSAFIGYLFLLVALFSGCFWTGGRGPA